MNTSKNRVAKKAKPTEIVSQWAQLIEGLQFSPQEFYGKVEQALRDRQVPDLEMGRVDWPEGGILSAKREYLRLTRERLVFDICGAPFGTGFFVSSRLGVKPLTLSLVAIVLALAVIPAIGFCVLRPGWLTGLALAAMIVGFFVVVISAGHDLDSLLMRIPLVGYVYERFLRRITYYRIDRQEMYRQAVHNAVMQVIDEITTAKGIPRLSDEQRRPVLKALALR